MAHILYLFTLFIVGLFRFSGPFISCNSFRIFMSNEFKPLYNMLHISKMLKWPTR